MDLNKILFQRYTDIRGELTVCQDGIPFDIKRVFFIHGVNEIERGGHGHYKNRMILICIKGEVLLSVISKFNKSTHKLINDGIGILIEPEHWHSMKFINDDSILLVLASEKFDVLDYYYEEPI